MAELASVTDIRTRKVPAWNPDTRRHSGAVPGMPDAAPPVLPVGATTAHPCCRCVPPLAVCGLPTRKTPDGYLCEPQREAARESRAAALVELRSATSGMGVPTWRGGAT